MARDNNRPRGSAFTDAERTLLDLLCAGDDERSQTARAQLATARWGGYELDECECFLVQTDSPERIPHGGGPFSSLAVLAGDQARGHLDLWVVDGKLHSVNYMPFDGDHVELPSPSTHSFAIVS